MIETSAPSGVRIAKVEAIALTATFQDMYGDDVPEWLLFPAASHRVLPRRGQFATLVKIHADDGTVGIGECYGLPSPEVTATVVANILSPLLIGENVLATTSVWERLYQGQAAGGHTRGFYLEAMAGVDIALWDLKGKLLGQPVHRLLGGPVRERVPCYASPVAMHDDPELSARQALDFVAQGFKAFKVKVGRTPKEDGRHLAAVRAAVGDDVEILVDANCAYSLDVATEIGYVLRDNGISWFEEPLAVDDLDGLAELRRRTGLTMVNGETNFTRFDLRECLSRSAIDVYMPNIARCGGFTEAMRIVALASAFHVDIAPHGVGSGVSLAAALQLCAATPNLRTYEYNRLPNALREAILVEPPVFADGQLTVPDRPGIGVELNEDVVDRFTVARF
ncbi:MAG TPA: mandelate racemase/muconate lactonizing enzyme family protein [Actinokineospora sp.]|jgi:D-arabinonate dehydratase/D-galactarolactone cycloisomerase|nr:mandelate racemase/muconate lactonizing enzyme family protein [Actinokineospora sp.]